MIASIKVMDALKNIGLNLYERRIYTALLAKGIATPSELSEIANVPRSRTYDILESLAEKGFVIMQPSKPIKYVGVPPKEALERTKGIIEKKHQEILTRIDELKNSEIVEELENIHKEGLNTIQPHDLSGTIKGQEKIDRQLKLLFENADKEIRIVATEKGMKNLYEKHYKTLKKARGRGVSIKIAGPINEDIKDEFSKIAEIRHTNSPRGRVIIVDDKHIVTSLADDSVHDTQDVVFWAQSPHAVKHLGETVFNQFWKDKGNE